MSKNMSIEIGTKVEAGEGTEDHDTGTVLAINGDMALVAWDGAADKSEIALEALSEVAS